MLVQYKCEICNKIVTFFVSKDTDTRELLFKKGWKYVEITVVQPKLSKDEIKKVYVWVCNECYKRLFYE